MEINGADQTSSADKDQRNGIDVHVVESANHGIRMVDTSAGDSRKDVPYNPEKMMFC